MKRKWGKFPTAVFIYLAVILALIFLSSCSHITPHKLADQISKVRIKDRIEEFSSFQTRQFNTVTGKEAAERLVERLQECAGDKAEIEIIDHTITKRFDEHPSKIFKADDWIMPSVIARLKGTDPKRGSVIIGGHLDSLNGGAFHDPSIPNISPGADDNASGIAVALEVFCRLAKLDAKPKATVEFMAYSAEEVGLWGSNEISQWYKGEGRKVQAVIQLDMLLYSKSNAIDLIRDNTDPVLTKLAAYIAKDLGYPVTYSKCGYKCSDHASWTDAGYPSVFLFETKERGNPNIHTERDTLENAPNEKHAAQFGRVAIILIWELAYE